MVHFWAGKTDADVPWSLGMYMSGFFPCMMFGILGAATAIYKCADKNNRRKVFGIMFSAAACAFVCGITEPFEFAFMFVAPVLYFAYALLYGAFTVITAWVNFRAGFAFSAGATDLIFSSTLPAAKNTWLILPLGFLAFLSFYAVFTAMIKTMNLKTPGRGEVENEQERGAKTSRETSGSGRFDKIAVEMMDAVGGPRNVVSVDNCVTRLRLTLKDSWAVDEKKAKAAGALGVVLPGDDSAQIIIGQNAQFVADAFKRIWKASK